jgi:hypothetical protein
MVAEPHECLSQDAEMLDEGAPIGRLPGQKLQRRLLVPDRSLSEFARLSSLALAEQQLGQAARGSSQLVQLRGYLGGLIDEPLQKVQSVPVGLLRLTSPIPF